MIYKEYQDIPDEWSLVRLDQIAQVNPRKSKEILRNGEWVDIAPDTLVTFLAMEDVSASAKILNKQVKSYKEVESGYTSFQEKDILVAKITPCFENGKGAWANGLQNGIGFGSTEFHVLRARKGVNRKWLNYLTSSYYFRKRGEINMQGSAGQKRIPTDFVRSYRLPKPPKNEQDKIAQIISSWDEAISKTEKLIQAKKRYKKGLMQRLLSGKVRFPEFEGEDWVEVKLKKFFKPFSDKNKDNEDLPILSCSKVHGITLQSNIFDKRVASKDIKRYKVVERDDLIYDPMLLWDASIGFLKEIDRGVISPAYNTFKFKKNSGYRPFFEYLFDTHYMRYNYKAISQGTNRRRRKAPAEAFIKIDVRVPKSIKEQKKIAEILETLTREIELHKDEVELLKKQKKGLMQKLLTGKVRVK